MDRSVTSARKDPADTRTYLGLGLSIAYNATIDAPKFGVFRM